MSRPLFYDKKVISIADLQREATKKLPPMYRDYYNNGATDMIRLEYLGLLSSRPLTCHQPPR